MTWFSQSRVPKVKTSNVLTVETNDQLMLTALKTGQIKEFGLAKQQFCTCITLFVHFVAVVARLQREPPNFTF